MQVNAKSWDITEWVFWDFGLGHRRNFTFARRRVYHEF